MFVVPRANISRACLNSIIDLILKQVKSYVQMKISVLKESYHWPGRSFSLQ